jgi:hypothetical protein
MVHPAWGFTIGNQDDHIKAAEKLGTVTDGVVDIISRRTGMSRDESSNMVRNETWLGADRAVELGFADEIAIGPSAPIVAEILVENRGKSSANRVSASVQNSALTRPSVTEVSASADPKPEQRAVEQHPLVSLNQPPVEGTQNPSTEEKMSIPKNILTALSLNEDAAETEIVAAVEKLNKRAHLGTEIEKLIGASGSECLGEVRALKASKAQQDDLAREVGQVKATLARRDFDSALKSGTDDKKLSPAVAKMYTERFEESLKSSDGSSVVEDLRGFLRVAPRIVSAAIQPPQTHGSDPASLAYNGKTYAEMTGAERHNLWKVDAELFNEMRKDYHAQSAH